MSLSFSGKTAQDAIRDKYFLLKNKSFKDEKLIMINRILYS